MLEIGIWRELKSLLLPPGGVETDKVAGDLLHLALGLLLEPVPGS